MNNSTLVNFVFKNRFEELDDWFRIPLDIKNILC